MTKSEHSWNGLLKCSIKLRDGCDLGSNHNALNLPGVELSVHDGITSQQGLDSILLKTFTLPL